MATYACTDLVGTVCNAWEEVIVVPPLTLADATELLGAMLLVLVIAWGVRMVARLIHPLF